MEYSKKARMPLKISVLLRNIYSMKFIASLTEEEALSTQPFVNKLQGIPRPLGV
jgi:hypothetical protein